jgi:hypothetical protein
VDALNLATFLFPVKLYAAEPVPVNDHDFEAMALFESRQVGRRSVDCARRNRPLL